MLEMMCRSILLENILEYLIFFKLLKLAGWTVQLLVLFAIDLNIRSSIGDEKCGIGLVVDIVGILNSVDERPEEGLGHD